MACVQCLAQGCLGGVVLLGRTGTLGGVFCVAAGNRSANGAAQL